MENEKSIWNKTIFSETPNKYDDNFQIMNMKYKIKKIKNSKKENYKNIEELENIYDNPLIEGLKTKNTKKKTKKTDKNEKPQSESKSRDFDPNFLGLPDKDFDGVDSPDKGNKDDPRVAVINILKKIYKWINKINYTIAFYISKTLSVSNLNENDLSELARKGANSRKLNQKNDSKKDILVIQKYVGLFESVLVAFFATYNWFYIMFYYYTSQEKETNKGEDMTGKRVDMTGKRVEVPELSSCYIQEQIHNRADFMYIFFAFVNFFFIFALAFVEYLQSFMMKIIPNNLKYIFNYKGCFVAVFVLFILFFFNFNVFIYNFLIAVLRGDTKDVIVSLMYFFLLVIYFFGNYNMGFLPKTLSYTVNSFMGFIISPITSFISAFLRFIIVMLISVPLGAIACILYIVINSLFGIMINVDFFKYFGTFYRIHEFIRNNNDPEENKEKSNEDEFIYKVKSSYNKLIDFVYKYVFFIAYIIVLVIAIIDYNDNITNNTLRLRLIMLTAIFIFIMLLSMAGIYHFMKDDDKNQPVPTTPIIKKADTNSFSADIINSVLGLVKNSPSNISDKLVEGINGIDDAIASPFDDNEYLPYRNVNYGIDNNNIANNIDNTTEGVYKTSNDAVRPSAPPVVEIPVAVPYPYGIDNNINNKADNIDNETKGVYNISNNDVGQSAHQVVEMPVAVPYHYDIDNNINNTVNNIDNKTEGVYNTSNYDVGQSAHQVVPYRYGIDNNINNKAKNSIVDKINNTPFMKGIKNVSKGVSEIIPKISSAIKNKIKNSG